MGTFPATIKSRIKTRPSVSSQLSGADQLTRKDALDFEITVVPHCAGDVKIQSYWQCCLYNMALSEPLSDHRTQESQVSRSLSSLQNESIRS
jgi:hypothetical protein